MAGARLLLCLCGFALVAAGCGGAPVAASRTTPLPADTTLALPGLSAPVRVVTDRHGIPHLRAQTQADLYRAWGFVAARDRLWQMVHARQAARGDLWRWFGNRALRADGGAQLFELAARTERIWERERQDPAVRRPLEAYAAGVNAWMDLCRAGAAPWPAELERLGKIPEPWRPQDAYLILFGMAIVLDFDLPELREQAEIEQDGREAFLARRRYEGDFVYPTIPDRWARRMFQAPDSGGRHAPVAVRGLLPAGDPDGYASNVFAVGPLRSASRRPMLANDPHLPLTTPGTLHAIHLNCVEGRVAAAGAHVPGIPAIVSGRNRATAWGLTTLSADVIDVYADTLSRDHRQVRWQGQWVPVREGGYTMGYRAGALTLPTFGQKRRYTPHGPVVSLDARRHIAYSVRWAGDDRRVTLGRLLGLERSRSAAEVCARARSVLSPNFNFVAADTGGHVRYQAIGALPRRGFATAPGPLPGGGHEWLGLIGPDSLPAWDVPPGGVVVNGNNLPVGGAYFEPLPRYDWNQERALRMAERLEADPWLTLADLASVQNDVVSRTARRMLPLMLRHATEPLTEREREALDRLRRWRYDCRAAKVAPTLFRAWYNAYLRRSDLEGLHGLAAAALDGRASGELTEPGSGLPERPRKAVLAALDTALVRLEALLGPDLDTWTWGRAHRARFAHVLGWLEPALVPPTVPMEGDNVTPSVGRSNLPWEWRVTHGPVWRHVVDLADPDRSWCVVAPGNPSEGRHRTSLAERWSRHGYVPLDLRWDRIEAAKESEWRLAPEK